MSNHVSGLSFLERLLPRSAQASRQDDGRPSQPPVMGLEERMALPAGEPIVGGARVFHSDVVPLT